MPKLSSQYPFNARTTAAVTVMPKGPDLPEGHPVVVTSETEDFGRIVAQLGKKPVSGFLGRDEYAAV